MQYLRPVTYTTHLICQMGMTPWGADTFKFFVLRIRPSQDLSALGGRCAVVLGELPCILSQREGGDANMIAIYMIAKCAPLGHGLECTTTKLLTASRPATHCNYQVLAAWYPWLVHRP